MTDALFSTHVPVFTVADTVRGVLARDCVHLEIEETTAGLRSLVARFVARGPDPDGRAEQDLYLDGALLDFGAAIEVALGPADAQRVLFEGAISALQVRHREAAPPEVQIHAEDRCMDLRMTRRVRTWERASDADVARDIAAEHGLDADVDVDGPTHDRLQQWNQSDLAFLRERARRLQAEVWVLDGTLHFKARDRRAGPSLNLVSGNDLVEIDLCADLAHQRTEVHVSGYDASARARIDESADAGVIAAEVSGGRTGPAVLEQAFGARVSHRVRDVPLNDAEARAWAEAELLRRARAFVIARGTTSGSPDLVVGSTVTLDGVGAPFEGPAYYVTHVCHTYDLEQGHRTWFEAERATVSTP